MIFAKLDVCVWNHKRFVRAGPAACGFWMAALAYLRHDESSDGVIAEDVMGLLLGLGQREARKLADRLVDVGLFERHGAGYVLLGYTAKNETRQEIEARRAATRKRVDTHRLKVLDSIHAKNGNPVTNEVKLDVEATSGASSNGVTNAVSTLFVPGSDSDSGSFLVSSSRGERERGRPTDATKGARLRPDWKPKDETVAWVHERGVDAAKVLEEFVDYWPTKSGKDGVRLNWDLVFRGRVRKLIEYGTAPRLAPKPREWKPEAVAGAASKEEAQKFSEQIRLLASTKRPPGESTQ